MEPKFYKCNQCGNIAFMIQDSGVTPVCCGKPMTELVSGTVDASEEKHVPKYTVHANIICVQVGSQEHPMTEDHYIQWIFLRTRLGGQIRYLVPGEIPKVCFFIKNGDTVEGVYAFCNIHGLWKKTND